MQNGQLCDECHSYLNDVERVTAHFFANYTQMLHENVPKIGYKSCKCYKNVKKM